MKDFHVLEISEITGYDKDKKCLTYNTKVFEKEV
jgi:predicted AAA+ superfamily ATPase